VPNGLESTAVTASVPRRTDARRNRERLVAAATAVFAETGVDAPLDNIARRAGVGNATMYRNFPTREALLEAVLHGVHEELGRHAEELLDATPADQAFFRWLQMFVDYTQSYLGLPEPIMATMRDEESALSASCRAMRAMATRLLNRAQDAGEVRRDINAADICAHALGIAWATQQVANSHEQTARLLSVLMDGIRIR
jgi:AcrR family transcriptional regulator